MIKGWEHFKEQFRQFADNFILIGGVASHLQLEEIEAPRVRPTNDLDIVLILKPSDEFLARLKQYIMDGGYKIEKGDGNKSHFYRFQKPQSLEYPVMIELFSPIDKNFILFENQHIVPVLAPEGAESLSAILLDEDYFNLVKENTVEKDGVFLLNPWGLIPLKAQAYLEIKARKEDSKKWKKHRGDIINLAVSFLTEEQARTLAGRVRSDFEQFIQQLRGELDDEIVRGACLKIISSKSVIELLERNFLHS